MPQRVLIAPLHWGLGHATRCIPVIRQQVAAGNEVLLAASGQQEALLREHFPALEYVHIPFMEITYPVNGSMANHFFRSGPALVHSIIKEHKVLRQMVREKQLDLVISDSRFGLWTTQTKCVFITHQVEIQSPVFQNLINGLNRWVMDRYDEVWVPDYKEAPGLAGKLSHPPRLPKHTKYIGPISRFTGPLSKKPSKWKAVVIISGPEPQRSLFEAEMATRFKNTHEPVLILQGKPGTPLNLRTGNVQTRNHLPDRQLLEALEQSEQVIARSGYSTIMDLHVLGLKAEFHPTPGQTEQEYLASLHNINE